jgi:hypothetical protein
MGTGSITVSPRDFERVARAIERGDVHIVIKTNLPPDVGAQYFQVGNRLEVPPVIGREQEGLVLHECLHAAFDLARSPVNALDEEAASYVVDALYFRMTNLTGRRWNNITHTSAGVVASGLLHQYQVGRSAFPAVDTATWNALRGVVSTYPIYVSGPAGTGGSYPHNG